MVSVLPVAAGEIKTPRSGPPESKEPPPVGLPSDSGIRQGTQARSSADPPDALAVEPIRLWYLQLSVRASTVCPRPDLAMSRPSVQNLMNTRTPSTLRRTAALNSCFCKVSSGSKPG